MPGLWGWKMRRVVVIFLFILFCGIFSALYSGEPVKGIFIPDFYETDAILWMDDIKSKEFRIVKPKLIPSRILMGRDGFMYGLFVSHRNCVVWHLGKFNPRNPKEQDYIELFELEIRDDYGNVIAERQFPGDAVALDKDNNLYLLMPAIHREDGKPYESAKILKVTGFKKMEGWNLECLGEDIGDNISLEFMAMSSKGEIYISDYHGQIFKIDRFKGKRFEKMDRKRFDFGLSPSITLDSRDRLYIAQMTGDISRVVRMNNLKGDGYKEVRKVFETSGYIYPRRVRVDSKGRIYVIVRDSKEPDWRDVFMRIEDISGKKYEIFDPKDSPLKAKEFYGFAVNL